MNFQSFIDKAKRRLESAPSSESPLKKQEAPRERSDEERIQLLRNFVIKQVANGATVELQDDFSAVLIWGKRPNHILHLLLSLVTLGFWLIVWILIAMSSGETRRLYKIDKYGFISY